MSYVEQNIKWISVAKKAHELSTLRKNYQRLEDECMDELKELSNGQNCTGGIFRFMSIERKGSVNYAVIPELKGMDLECYRKESSFAWKLTNDNRDISI